MTSPPADPLFASPLQPRALTALRTATRSRHHRIDRQMDLRRLVEPQRHVRVLQVFEAFHGPWEAALAAALPTLSSWLQARSRLPFLRQDLAALRAEPLEERGPVLDLDGPAEAWGSLYVMEGSALGGQVITRALASAGIGRTSGGAYFHGWGDRTGRMWQEFRVRLEAAVADPDSVARACAGACLTFDTLSSFLEHALDERIAVA